MGNPLGPKYILYNYMDPLGLSSLEVLAKTRRLHCAQRGGDKQFRGERGQGPSGSNPKP